MTRNEHTRRADFLGLAFYAEPARTVISVVATDDPTRVTVPPPREFFGLERGRFYLDRNPFPGLDAPVCRPAEIPRDAAGRYTDR